MQTLRRSVLAGWLLVTAAAVLPAQELVVGVDPRVELVSALFRAGGRPEYRQGRVARWNRALDSLFVRHAGHDAVAMTTRLSTQYNVGYFAPISLALHLRATPALSLEGPLAGAASLHRTWKAAPDSTRLVVSLYEAFRRDADFASVLRAEQAMVDSADARLRRVVEGRVARAWFARFWRDSSIARLAVSPGLTTGTASYGLDVVLPDGTREGYAIIGVSRVDDAGLPLFDARDQLTVVHELNHPYVTAALRAAPPELRRVADSLHRGVATQMRSIGYGSGDAMLNEALVRAAVIRYLATNDSPAAAAREVEAQRAEGFVWIADVVAALEEYERDPASFRAFRDYLPRLVVRLRELVGRDAG